MAYIEKNDLNRGQSLPPFYDENRLVILARDPFCIFSYWEINQATRENLKKQVGEKQWPELSFLLRVYKYTRGFENTVESYFDINIKPEDNHWYIMVQDAGRLYHSELGWKLPQGSFQPLLSSNRIRTPSDGISDLIDEEWQLPDWKAQKLFRRISLYHFSSTEFFRRAKINLRIP